MAKQKSLKEEIHDSCRFLAKSLCAFSGSDVSNNLKRRGVLNDCGDQISHGEVRHEIRSFMESYLNSPEGKDMRKSLQDFHFDSGRNSVFNPSGIIVYHHIDFDPEEFELEPIIEPSKYATEYTPIKEQKNDCQDVKIYAAQNVDYNNNSNWLFTVKLDRNQTYDKKIIYEKILDKGISLAPINFEKVGIFIENSNSVKGWEKNQGDYTYSFELFEKMCLEQPVQKEQAVDQVKSEQKNKEYCQDFDIQTKRTIAEQDNKQKEESWRFQLNISPYKKYMKEVVFDKTMERIAKYFPAYITRCATTKRINIDSELMKRFNIDILVFNLNTIDGLVFSIDDYSAKIYNLKEFVVSFNPEPVENKQNNPTEEAIKPVKKFRVKKIKSIASHLWDPYIAREDFTVEYGYDLKGNLIQDSDSLGNWIKRKYDSYNNLIEEEDNTGRITIYEYEEVPKE